MEEKNKKIETSYVIANSYFIKGLFIVCLLLFGTALFFSVKANAGLFCYIGFGGFALAGLVGTWISLIWKIKVDGEEIEYCDIFRKRHKYSFDDITRAVEFNYFGDNAICCYKGDKKMFKLDNNIAGYSIFEMDLKFHNITIENNKRRIDKKKN